MIRSHTLAASGRRWPASLAALECNGRGLRRGDLEDPDPGLGYCLGTFMIAAPVPSGRRQRHKDLVSARQFKGFRNNA